MITKIIKASGGDYTSVNLGVAANNSLTDDTDLIVSGNIVETVRYVSTISLNGYRLRIYPDVSHEGNPGVGRRISVTLASNSYPYFNIDLGSGGRFEFYGLELSSSDWDYNNTYITYIRSLSGSGVIKFDSNICDCSKSDGSHGAYGAYVQTNQDKTQIITNNKIYRSRYSGLKLNFNSSVVSDLQCENNSIDDCNGEDSTGNGGIYISSITGVNIFVKNNVCTRNGYRDFRYTVASPEFFLDNNSDSDGTFVTHPSNGTGYNNESTTIIPADEFLSLDYTNIDYLKISTNSSGLFNTGIAPIYALYDIAGIERGLDNRYCRGCYEINTDTPGRYTESIYWDLSSTPKTDEIANIVNVKALPLTWSASSETVYNSSDQITIPASGSIDVTLNFDSLPVDPDTVVATLTNVTGSSTISVENYYAWGGYITVTGSSGNVFTLGATGSKGAFRSESTKTAEDSDSILEYGKQVYNFEDNHLIQDSVLAQSIADILLSNYKDIRQDVSIGWPGDCIVELADRVTCEEYKDDSITTIGNFYIVRQNLSFNGSLNLTTDLRRV